MKTEPKTVQNKTDARKPLAFETDSVEAPKPTAAPSEAAPKPAETPQNATVGGSGKPFPKKTASKEGKRHSLKIVDEKFDVSGVQDDNVPLIKAAFKNSVSDPEFRAWAGISAADAPPAITIPPALIGSLFDLGAQLETFIYAKKTGIDARELYPLVAWDKDEHSLIDPQGAALATKYIPESWMKYADVGVFFMSVSMLLKKKADIVAAYAKKKFDAQIAAGERPATTHVPTPTQPSSKTPAVDVKSDSALADQHRGSVPSTLPVDSAGNIPIVPVQESPDMKKRSLED